MARDAHFEIAACFIEKPADNPVCGELLRTRDENVRAFAFWAINIGLMLEILLSLLPVGLMQTYQSVSVGYWSARSSEFMQTHLMQTLRWLRMIGDTIFALGAVSFVYFALSLMWQRPEKKAATVPAEAVEAV